MTFDAFLDLTRLDRLILHAELSAWIDDSNAELEDTGASAAPPRAIRREGLF